MKLPSLKIFLCLENTAPKVICSPNKSAQLKYIETIGFGLITWLVLGILSRIIFVSYMAHEGFFSYDFFADGLFGLSIFFLISELMLVLISIYLFGSLIVSQRFLLTGKRVSWHGWLFLIINLILLWILAIWLNEKTHSDEILLFLLSGGIVCFFICLHLSHVFYGTLKMKLTSLSVVTVLVIVFSFMPQFGFAKAVGFGLYFFGSGGDLPILIKRNSSDKNACGKLLLLSPNNVYIRDQKGNLHKFSNESVDIEISKDLKHFTC